MIYEMTLPSTETAMFLNSIPNRTKILYSGLQFTKSQLLSALKKDKLNEKAKCYFQVKKFVKEQTYEEPEEIAWVSIKPST